MAYSSPPHHSALLTPRLAPRCSHTSLLTPQGLLVVLSASNDGVIVEWEV